MENDLIKEFGYLMDKIRDAKYVKEPFDHVVIDNFLSPEHFEEITKSTEVNRPVYESTEEMISDLQGLGYRVQPFPGCTTSVKEYLKCYNSDKWPVDDGLLEGYGLTLRLRKYQTPILERLINFLNSETFHKFLEEKFEITRSNYVETAIQKYLHGYEISPHPDIRKKCLTYMLNINTTDETEKMHLHTYLMEFKPERKYVYDYWKYNKTVDRCWVPWNWCESRVETTKNNSIVIFAPSDDTLHAVKLDYDHLKLQRTQVYGNLWYDESEAKHRMEYEDIDLLNLRPKGKKIFTKKRIVNKIKQKLLRV